MIKILFYTFPVGHLVSDKEFDRLQKGFAKEDMELIRWHKDKDASLDGPFLDEYDIVMVKGFSHTWNDIPHDKPIVYLSIGTEWKKGIDLTEANEPLRELYRQAQATVHISRYCQEITHKVFGQNDKMEYVIIPACEPNLPSVYPNKNNSIKLATTCIPRPVKRVEETERLCKKYGIELIGAYGTVDNFDYYHTCHGYIHLSRKEGMPNTVLEALAYGLPCIVTNHGGAQEIAQVVIENDPPDTMWDMDHIEPVDDFLFEFAIKDFVENMDHYRLRVRESVLTDLNDRVTAQKFKSVFTSLL